MLCCPMGGWSSFGKLRRSLRQQSPMLLLMTQSCQVASSGTACGMLSKLISVLQIRSGPRGVLGTLVPCQAGGRSVGDSERGLVGGPHIPPPLFRLGLGIGTDVLGHATGAPQGRQQRTVDWLRFLRSTRGFPFCLIWPCQTRYTSWTDPDKQSP